ncbi:MAG: 3-isopropylmalate dehydratase [Candidatus Lokiarchaeota archaeon]|nr:3-isopropylmalate dehydratase [Candidatus Lokiarchaeota archaeon]
MSFIIDAKKIWKFGDNIDTDIIIPGRYLTLRNPNEMASHAFEPLNPNLGNNIEKGDIIVAGKNFGCGSSREEAPFVLKVLGISAIIAESYARIFYRNAINLGLPLFELKDASKIIKEGDKIQINVLKGILEINGTNYKGTALPEFLIDIIKEGGATKAVKKRLGIV